jgi:Nucleotidyl transferase AbiEii toxin, Type IV TA system
MIALGDHHPKKISAHTYDVETGEAALFSPKLEILPAAQRLVWEDLNQTPRSFVLYGGTAIALRLGHRQSIDFDLFSNESFEPSSLLLTLRCLREARTNQRGDNTLSVVVDRSGPAKISFFGDVRMNRVQDPDLAADNGLQNRFPAGSDCNQAEDRSTACGS